MNQEQPPSDQPERDEPHPEPASRSGKKTFAELTRQAPVKNPLLMGCLGVGSFVVFLGVFGISMIGMVSSDGSIIAGLGGCLIVVLALFWIRAKNGRSPALGAVAIGAALALAVVGPCTLAVGSLPNH
ncbi:MAG: hypothetical protein ABJF01_19855 [bacterium]